MTSLARLVGYDRNHAPVTDRADAYDALVDRCKTEIMQAIKDGKSVNCGSYDADPDDFATFVAEHREFTKQNLLCLTDPIAYQQWLERCLEQYADSHADSLAKYHLAEEAEYAADSRADFME